MNSDFISRSALLEELKEKVYPEKYGERCNAIDVIYAVLQVIDEQPIAHDVDKVIKHIQISSTDEDGIICYVDKKPVITKELAEKIVKFGGVD